MWSTWVRERRKCLLAGRGEVYWALLTGKVKVTHWYFMGIMVNIPTLNLMHTPSLLWMWTGTGSLIPCTLTSAVGVEMGVFWKFCLTLKGKPINCLKIKAKPNSIQYKINNEYSTEKLIGIFQNFVHIQALSCNILTIFES